MQTYPSAGVQVCVLLLFLVLAALKLWSTSYFMYSMLASVLTGAIVTVAVHTAAQAWFPHARSISDASKLALGGAAVLAFVVLVAYRAESNRAPVLRIPRRDCK